MSTPNEPDRPPPPPAPPWWAFVTLAFVALILASITACPVTHPIGQRLCGSLALFLFFACVSAAFGLRVAREAINAVFRRRP